MSRPNDELSLSITNIEGMEPSKLFMCGKQLGINNYSDMQDLKQKIILNVMKEKNVVEDTNFYTKDFVETKEMTFHEDELRRNYLKAYVEEITSIYNNIKKLAKVRVAVPGGIEITEKDDPLITKIHNEFEDIQDQLKGKMKLISKKPNCALLICGDSGAGKSSFINLLINEELLPTSIRSNTSCQVRLTYDKNERAEILDNDENPVTIMKKDFSTNLKSYLENFENRKQVSCRSATVFLNSPILEGGLDIYDTIGLGETQAFNDELTKDMNDITGVLFLLKKNNPIGDNTVGGLSKVITHMAKAGIPPGSMHFIINMCDLLERTDEKEELRKNVSNQIREKCVGITPKISTFSTKRELYLQKNQFMSKDYKKIMTTISKLHINSINTNTVSIFEYIFRFTYKTMDYIVEAEDYAAEDRQNKRERIQKMRNLESDRKMLNLDFKKQNEKFLKEKQQEYKKKVEAHFYSAETKKKVVTEVVNNHGQLFGMTNNDDIDREIMNLTQNAILKNFKEFIEKENLLKICCDQMLANFLRQFAEHQKQKDKIHQEMNHHIDTFMNFINGDMTTMEFNDLINLPIYQRKFFQVFSPIMVPSIEIKNTIKKEIESLFAWIISKINLVNISKFYEDTRQYVDNKSTSCYGKFIHKRRNLNAIMECLFQAPKQVTADFEKYLEEDMKYLAKNIDLLQEDMRHKKKVIQTYQETKQKLHEIYNELCKVNLLYLQKEKNDAMREKMQIPIIDDKDSETKSKPILFNRNRIVYTGYFKDAPSTDSAILVFKSSDEKSWRDTYQEYLKHADISKNTEISELFIKLRDHILSSISDTNDLYPMFFIKGIDQSLKTHMADFNNSIINHDEADKERLDEIILILKQILSGLSFLHSKNLVHYDLTIDSIGYNTFNSKIKLTSISLETVVKIDNCLISRDYVNSVSHFPVDILDKTVRQKYTTTTDMYCLGIILYEMGTTLHPFLDVIEGRDVNTVDQFVDILRTCKLENIVIKSVFNGGYAEMVNIWSKLCWKNMYKADEFYKVIEKPAYYEPNRNHKNKSF